MYIHQSFNVPNLISPHMHIQIYNNFNDRYNVRIGPKHGDNQFFEIATVNGGAVVPGFDVSGGECNASIIGSTEGALYKTHLTTASVLWYWRKSLCRQVPLYYEKTVQKGDFEAYKYVLRENVYDRMVNESDDCYKGNIDPLPDGLSDLSKCFYGMLTDIDTQISCNFFMMLPWKNCLFVFCFGRYAIRCIESTFLRTLSEHIDRSTGWL